MIPASRWLRSLAVGRRFLPFLAPMRGKYARLGALSVAVAAMELLRPWPVQWIVDHALAPVPGSERDPSAVVLAGALAAALIVLVRATAQYRREVDLGLTELGVTRELRHRLFGHLARLSPRFHARNKSGDLLVRLMGDVPMVSTMLVESFVELCLRAVLILATVGVMLWLDPWLTVLTLLMGPLLLALVRWVSRRIHVAVSKQRRKEGDLADYLHEAIAATETIQALGGSEEVVRRFARSNRRSARAGAKTRRLAARLSAGVESLLGVGLALVLAIGSGRVLEGELSTGELLVFLSYVRSLSKPIRSASKQVARVAKGTACGERLLAILDETPEVTDAPDAREAPESPSALSFEGVGFAYEDDVPVLHEIRTTFRRGELSALVGPSGAGKSTLASLAMRLVDPQEGRVTLDGEDLRALRLASLRARVGLCLQRTMLFGESVRENLLLGCPEASEEDMLVALDAAGALEFVLERPDGLDGTLGSGGTGLSGGQLSRLSIARTLLRRSAVLLVDEPFAGLDAEAARRLGETLRELARDRIVIAIAHDFASLDPYDHVVFLERGRVELEGTHRELVVRSPSYRRTVRTSLGAES